MSNSANGSRNMKRKVSFGFSTETSSVALTKLFRDAKPDGSVFKREQEEIDLSQ